MREKKIKIPKEENSLRNHITTMKEFHESLNKTIQQVTTKTPTSTQIAKIMFAISNLINNIDIITESNHLDKVIDIIGTSEDVETVNDIYELLCEVKNFLHIFSLSFIEDTVNELPVTMSLIKKLKATGIKMALRL